MDVNNTTNIGKVKLIMLKGEAGNSIVSIEKTSTTDTHEIYTITLTDGSTQQIAVARGNGIVSIEKTATVGLVDTYTITFTDDSTTTFDIINGQSYTVPTDGVLYYDGSTVPEGFEETPAPSGSGQYAEIDDTTPSVSKTYSSQKIEEISLHHYSTTEHIVGTWIDGSTLYEKTVDFGSISAGQGKEVNHNISNFGGLVDLRGRGYNESDQAWTIFQVVDDSDSYIRKVNVNGTRIRVYSGTNSQALSNCFITIQYTKSS